ncbi:substrate-binding domain-containing protein [Rivularia sp. UHCC 0363]|uniref:substrate-binding domain-containing protein n=1 Tax=Rivularia sp. UHCC 0363 TaxID=3110244 RepID=UPI002B2106D7|nr:substrate-binding domain-containing protein [Rivularia sp. UHCC 0363]MEA5598425.1 substrate-binding domain-containing protein [Rivularia sp. UHCC 0363]
MMNIESFYSEYACTYNAPLSCKKPLETALQMRGAKFCLECGFPSTLSVHTEIKGQRGSYKVTEYLGVRGLGRLYAGIQLNNREPVIIKEYLLPQNSFNQEEALKRKETFKRLAGVNLADGREQNFRLIQTWEAIADEKGERCYLITKDTTPSETLGQYLINRGGMKAPKVREFLIQALQTLVFLHTQKLSFPSGQVQKGLEHGNINLDSLLIKLQSNKQFFTVFFCDLAKWENLFIPPKIPQPPKNTYKQDLESLGLIAFYLWLGKTTHPNSGKKIDPAEHELLPNTDNDLKKFIYRLLGFDIAFQDAASAREELLNLSAFNPESKKQKSGKKKKGKKRLPLFVILLGLLAFALLGGVIGHYIFKGLNSENAKDTGLDKNFDQFADVPNIDSGDFTYTSGKNSNWRFLLGKEPVDERKLDELLKKPKPNVEAIFKHVTNDNDEINSEIGKVQRKEVGFAITGLVDKNRIGNDMDSEIVAHDGMVVFVAFRNDNNKLLINALQGKITHEQLRKIYTGKITKWREIVPNIREDIRIEPYLPVEKEAVEKFKQLIFSKNSDINLFNENKEKFKTENTRELIINMGKQLNSGENVGVIGFGFLSKIIDQCTVYPLAITDENNQPIQPIFSESKKTAIKISDDLCKMQGKLYIDMEEFQKYPLRYDLYVVYSKDESKEGGHSFASLLNTNQGQCLLKNVFLVPLRNVKENDCK